jgi:excinuclease ABC subunit A
MLGIFKMPSNNDYILVRGARVHNLKNVSVKIPKGKLVVITGLSGSGKSSLAFDTIFAEGQRRYVESMSTYARQFLGVLEKPDVDEISNLSPVISIDQKTAVLSPRSTVGTMSEIYDYLRLLFTSIGVPTCSECGQAMLKKNFQLKKQEANSVKIWECPNGHMTFPEITISMFSFNSPAGACLVCRGLGDYLEIDSSLVIPNRRLTLQEGAIRPFQRINAGNTWLSQGIQYLSKKYNLKFNLSIDKLPQKTIDLILFGEPKAAPVSASGFEGVIAYLLRRYEETDSEYLRKEIEKYMVRRVCPECGGARLKKEILGIKVAGYSIIQLVSLPLSDLLIIFKTLENEQTLLSPKDKEIVGQLLSEIKKRLQFLLDVGLPYLTLDRSAVTLAGGEAQRIRLASQLGSSLVGIIYILDEPSIGLHSKDHDRLLKTILKLKENGNTVIVVEHDEATMKIADWVIDVGPGAGEAGGKIVAQGPIDKIKANKASLTGQYLIGEKAIAVPKKRRTQKSGEIVIKNATQFNLKNVTVTLPLNKLLVVTGVSGSGKSTIISDILAAKLLNHFHRAKNPVGAHESMTGYENLNKVIVVDQSPIGRNVRSNPATYTGVFTHLRQLFASLPEAKKKRLGANHFSFNLKGGRCEVCRGDGLIKFEMHFLPNVFITCENCGGKRYTQEVLDIKFRDKSIADVLQMTIDQALVFFKEFPNITDKLKVLHEVGLGYLRLGQPATMLSGGEAQRVKLATELARTSTGKTLYILDEPTTGLHFEDTARLLTVLHKLVDRGNSVIVVEHNIDIIKNADWIIDIGPDGGKGGGNVVAVGTPEEVAKVTASYTGQYLKKVL